jgi:hypothetical protein
MTTNWIVPNRNISTSLTEIFSVLFSSVVRQMPGHKTQRRGTACTITTYGGYISQRLSITLTSNVTILGSNPRKPSCYNYAPHNANCLLRYGPQFAHFGVFKHDGKSLPSAQSHLQFKVSVTEPSDVVTQECLNRPRDVDWRFRTSLRPQLALRLVVNVTKFNTMLSG